MLFNIIHPQFASTPPPKTHKIYMLLLPWYNNVKQKKLLTLVPKSFISLLRKPRVFWI